jgi:hypothetical protein
MSNDTFVSLDVLSLSLGLPRAYLRRLTINGQLPYLDVSGRRRYKVADVESALAIVAAQPAREGRSPEGLELGKDAA